MKNYPPLGIPAYTEALSVIASRSDVAPEQVLYMDFNPLDLILHLDAYLDLLVNNYGPWIYAILFAVIFCETGLVVMPFLPGDSLLFIAGAVAAGGGMDPVLLGGLLIGSSS